MYIICVLTYQTYDMIAGVNPVDPDLIFPEVQTCSLEEIFGCREGINRKYVALIYIYYILYYY